MLNNHPLRWLREAGVLLLTVSLLFLPWLHYSDRFGDHEQVIVIMGWEFILNPLGDLTPSVPLVIIGFICFWVAYILSRRLPTRDSFLFLYPFFAACTFYLAMYSRYFFFAPRGFRGTPSFLDTTFMPASGLNLSCLGAFLLLAGILFIQTNRIRFAAFILGGFSGWTLIFFILLLPAASFIPESDRFPCYLGFAFMGITAAFWLSERSDRTRDLTIGN